MASNPVNHLTTRSGMLFDLLNELTDEQLEQQSAWFANKVAAATSDDEITRYTLALALTQDILVTRGADGL